MKRSLKIALIVIASVVIAVMLALSIFYAYLLYFNSHPKSTYDVSEKQDDGNITVMNFNVRCLTPEDLGEKSEKLRPCISTKTSSNCWISTTFG